MGHKPRSLDFAAAAALPLTTITAWETLFDRFRLDAGAADSKGTLLVLGAAGPVKLLDGHPAGEGADGADRDRLRVT